MNYQDYYNILENFINSDKKHWHLSNFGFTMNQCKNEYKEIYNPYLVVYTFTWKMWQNLLKKGYTEEKLINYFLEIIRYKLPQLKDARLYIYNLNNMPLILNLPIKESDKFLYII